MTESARQLGRQRALLFQGFACFAHEQARALGLDRLHFVTREGVFFKAVFDALFAEAPDGGSPIDTVLIEASRQSTFGPSLACSDTPDFTRLWNLYPRMSPQAFLKSLNLDDDEFGRYFTDQGMALDEIVENPAQNKEFVAVLNHHEFASRLAESLERDRALAQAYFSKYFDEKERVGLVEIGWQGSIQDNLALICPEIDFHGLYMGLAISKIESPANSTKTAYGPNRNLSGKFRKLLDAVNVLEYICLSTGGSVVRYEQNPSGGAGARRCPDQTEDALIEGFSVPFQHGVVESSFPEHGRMLIAEHRNGDLKRRAISQWKSLLSDPHPQLVQHYFSLKSNEEFGLGEFRDQSHTPSWGTILLAPFSGIRRSSLVRYLTYSQWAQGMRHRQDLPTAKRWILYALMRVAIGAKSAKHGLAARSRIVARAKSRPLR